MYVAKCGMSGVWYVCRLRPKTFPQVWGVFSRFWVRAFSHAETDIYYYQRTRCDTSRGVREARTRVSGATASRGVALSESALTALKSVKCMVHALRSSKATGLTAVASAAPLNVTVV